MRWISRRDHRKREGRSRPRRFEFAERLVAIEDPPGQLNHALVLVVRDAAYSAEGFALVRAERPADGPLGPLDRLAVDELLPQGGDLGAQRSGLKPSPAPTPGWSARCVAEALCARLLCQLNRRRDRLGGIAFA